MILPGFESDGMGGRAANAAPEPCLASFEQPISAGCIRWSNHVLVVREREQE